MLVPFGGVDRIKSAFATSCKGSDKNTTNTLHTNEEIRYQRHPLRRIPCDLYGSSPPQVVPQLAIPCLPSHMPHTRWSASDVGGNLR